MGWLNNAFQILLFVGIAFTAIGSIGKSIIDNKNQQKVDLERKEQTEKMDTLVNSIGEVKKQLKPFEEYAKQKFPDKDLDEALELLQKQLKSTSDRVTIIETKIKPRVIDSEKMNELIEKLKPVSNNIIIECESGNAESIKLMNQIVSIFNRDGRRFQFSQVTRLHPVSGLFVVGKNNNLDDESKLILDSFKFLGMQVAKLENEKPDKIKIIVGLNPNYE